MRKQTIGEAETLGGCAEAGMGEARLPSSCASITAISRAQTSQSPRMCSEGDRANFWSHFKVPGLRVEARTQLEERAHTGRHTQLQCLKQPLHGRRWLGLIPREVQGMLMGKSAVENLPLL